MGPRQGPFSPEAAPTSRASPNSIGNFPQWHASRVAISLQGKGPEASSRILGYPPPPLSSACLVRQVQKRGSFHRATQQKMQPAANHLEERLLDQAQL